MRSQIEFRMSQNGPFCSLGRMLPPLPVALLVLSLIQDGLSELRHPSEDLRILGELGFSGTHPLLRGNNHGQAMEAEIGQYDEWCRKHLERSNMCQSL